MKIKEIMPHQEGRERLEAYILQNKMGNGQKLPTERELCDRWSMNRETLRKSLYHLGLEDKIYSVQGSGNYVKKEKYERNLAGLESLTEWGRSKGLTVTAKVISFGVIEADKKISRHLQLVLGEKVFFLVRCRYVNDEPLAIEYIYLPYSAFEGIEEFDFERLSLYHVLEKYYHTSLKNGNESVSITYIDEFEANFLQVPEGTAAFFTAGVVYDTEGKPTEYCKTVSRYDRLTFSFLSKELISRGRG